MYLCNAVQLTNLLAERYSLVQTYLKLCNHLISSSRTKVIFPFLSSFLPSVNFLCVSLCWRCETWQANRCVEASQKFILCCHGNGGCHSMCIHDVGSTLVVRMKM